jgi:hypothetical protein
MPNGVAVHLPVELEPTAERSIEFAIGEATAVAASLLAAEIEEWRVNKRQLATTQQATDAIVRLYELRRAVLATGELLMNEFEVVARQHGFQALRQHCGNSDDLVMALVDGVIKILTGVVRTQAN